MGGLQKKVENGGCFFVKNVDLSSTQGALCTVSVFFYFYNFTYLGGAYAPNASPCLQACFPFTITRRSREIWARLTAVEFVGPVSAVVAAVASVACWYTQTRALTPELIGASTTRCMYSHNATQKPHFNEPYSHRRQRHWNIGGLQVERRRCENRGAVGGEGGGSE